MAGCCTRINKILWIVWNPWNKMICLETGRSYLTKQAFLHSFKENLSQWQTIIKRANCLEVMAAFPPRHIWMHFLFFNRKFNKAKWKTHITSEFKRSLTFWKFKSLRKFFFSFQIFIKVTADGEAANKATTPGKYHCWDSTWPFPGIEFLTRLPRLELLLTRVVNPFASHLFLLCC